MGTISYCCLTSCRPRLNLGREGYQFTPQTHSQCAGGLLKALRLLRFLSFLLQVADQSVTWDGKTFHRQCFTCSKCEKQLQRKYYSCISGKKNSPQKEFEVAATILLRRSTYTGQYTCGTCWAAAETNRRIRMKT